MMKRLETLAPRLAHRLAPRLAPYLARALALAVTLSLLGGVGAAPTSAGKTTERKEGGTARDPLEAPARGRLIVRYCDTVRYCVHCLLETGQGFTAAVETGGAELEALHRQIGAVSARSLFRPSAFERTSFSGSGPVPADLLRTRYREGLAGIRERFPARSRRIAPDADAPDLHHVYLVQISRRQSVEAAARRIARSPHILYAEPDYGYRLDAMPNDPYFDSAGSWGQDYDDLWALKEDKTDAVSAWDVTRGEGVIVGVVDSGVERAHEDLAGNVWKNPREIAGNGLDDDGNGFVDDVWGWNFVASNGNTRDDNSHGTHVSGTIAAVGDNGVGIVGMAPAARILPVKGFDRRGVGHISDLAPAIVYAAANGASVINNSWGCGFCPHRRIARDAVRTAHALGALTVFSAGNSAASNRWESPQNLHHPKPLVVAASGPDDRATWFSNFGSAVDLAAPGGGRNLEDANILSLRARRCSGCKEASLDGRKYVRFQGTSMSAPHAAGAAALLLAYRPTLQLDQVRGILKVASVDVGPAGFDLRTGAGRLDAARALEVDSLGEALITSPTTNSVPRGEVIPIRGTAGGRDFSHYELFVQREGDDEWQSLGSPVHTPVRDGELGRWPRSARGTGWNLLRLEVTTTDGRIWTDVVSVGRQPRLRRADEGLAGMAWRPDVSGRRIVWQQLDKPVGRAEGHLYLYDLATGRRTRLTEEPIAAARPRISGDRIVWRHRLDEDTPSDDSAVLCTYNTATGTCPVEVLSDTGVDDDPVISGDIVAWKTALPAGDGAGTRFIQVLDLGTGSAFELAERPVQSLTVHDGRVAWIDSLEERFAVFEAASEETRSFEWPSGDRIYTLALQGDALFYRATHDDSTFDGYDLRRLDLQTGVETVLIDGTFVGGAPAVNGRTIAWAVRSDIQTWDLTARRRGAVVVHPLVLRTGAAVSDHLVAWIDLRHAFEPAGRLYYARLPHR